MSVSHAGIALLRPIDAALNKVTMYKLTGWSLMLLLVVSLIYSGTGILSISTGGLALSIGILLASCFAANLLFARLFGVVWNIESWLITALILACILPAATSPHRALALAVTGVIAMAIKYLVVVRGSHFLNPAAAAALIASLTGLLPVTWWIAAPPLLPIVLILGLLILRKTRRFQLFLAFAATALLAMLIVGLQQGEPAGTTLSNALLSWPLVFLGTIMLTEPSTLPAGRRDLLAYGALVGVVFGSQLHLAGISASPHLALVVGNLFALAVTPKRSLQVRLKTKQELAPGIFDLAFEQPAGKRLPFQPGQYAEWTIDDLRSDIRGNRRTFSLASSPEDDELHIGIKTYERSSSYKRKLLALKAGDMVQVAHVGGSFTLPARADEKVLFVAGGIGITPFVSMLRWLTKAGKQVDVVMLYVVRNETEAVYMDEIRAAKAIGVKTYIVTGRLTSEALLEQVPDAAARLAYISGPDALVRATRDLLTEAGTPRRRIKTDYFSGY